MPLFGPLLNDLRDYLKEQSMPDDLGDADKKVQRRITSQTVTGLARQVLCPNCNKRTPSRYMMCMQCGVRFDQSEVKEIGITPIDLPR